MTYKNILYNDAINTLFRKTWHSLAGETLPVTDGSEGRGSTDAGNVTHAFPSAQVHIGVTDGEEIPLHSREFCEIAGTLPAIKKAIRMGIAMAEIGLHYLQDPSFREKALADFRKAKELCS